jgi:D-glycero-D-manno-heptose 1,7-bisphosphate phosphatase
MKSAVFIERDGLLNEVRVERQQQVVPLTVEEFKVRKEAGPVLKKLKAAGFLILVTTNQPGVSRGYLPRRELDRMHDVLRRCLPIDDLFLCPHDEMDRCPCRKPKPGLFTEAAFKWHLNLDRCYVISDKWQDADAAMNTGCTSLLIKSPWNGRGHHDFILSDLSTAAEKIFQLHAPYQALEGRSAIA